MKCKDLMSSDVQSCRPDHSAEDCARLMKEHDVGFMPIVDESGKLVGTITDRDLTLRVLAEGKAGNATIGDVMTSGVVTCGPEDDVAIAERKMAENQISRIVVADDGRCLGVISLQNIELWESDAERSHTLERSIKARAAPSQVSL